MPFFYALVNEFIQIGVGQCWFGETQPKITFKTWPCVCGYHFDDVGAILTVFCARI